MAGLRFGAGSRTSQGFGVSGRHLMTGPLSTQVKRDSLKGSLRFRYLDPSRACPFARFRGLVFRGLLVPPSVTGVEGWSVC